MKIMVSELAGLKSLRIINVFYTLMIGLKMLPTYIKLKEDDFFEAVQKLSDEEKIKVLRDAVRMVPLDPEEAEVALSFCLDPNGLPYSKASIKNLEPNQIMEMIVAVCFEYSKIKPHMITNDEKKN